MTQKHYRALHWVVTIGLLVSMLAFMIGLPTMIVASVFYDADVIGYVPHIIIAAVLALLLRVIGEFTSRRAGPPPKGAITMTKQGYRRLNWFLIIAGILVCVATLIGYAIVIIGSLFLEADVSKYAVATGIGTGLSIVLGAAVKVVSRRALGY